VHAANRADAWGAVTDAAETPVCPVTLSFASVNARAADDLKGQLGIGVWTTDSEVASLRKRALSVAAGNPSAATRSMVAGLVSELAALVAGIHDAATYSKHAEAVRDIVVALMSVSVWRAGAEEWRSVDREAVRLRLVAEVVEPVEALLAPLPSSGPAGGKVLDGENYAWFFDGHREVRAAGGNVYQQIVACGAQAFSLGVDGVGRFRWNACNRIPGARAASREEARPLFALAGSAGDPVTAIAAASVAPGFAQLRPPAAMSNFTLASLRVILARAGTGQDASSAIPPTTAAFGMHYYEPALGTFPVRNSQLVVASCSSSGGTVRPAFARLAHVGASASPAVVLGLEGSCDASGTTVALSVATSSASYIISAPSAAGTFAFAGAVGFDCSGGGALGPPSWATFVSVDPSGGARVELAAPRGSAWPDGAMLAGVITNAGAETASFLSREFAYASSGGSGTGGADTATDVPAGATAVRASVMWPASLGATEAGVYSLNQAGEHVHFVAGPDGAASGTLVVHAAVGTSVDAVDAHSGLVIATAPATTADPSASERTAVFDFSPIS
jgi:hypothetical protein